MSKKPREGAVGSSKAVGFLLIKQRVAFKRHSAKDC